MHRAYATVDELCADPAVDVVYVASPHQMHASHAIAAARHGKHVLVEKPMSLSLTDCTRMIDAASAAGVQLVVGHSHGFDAPIARARALIDTRHLRPRADDPCVLLHRLPVSAAQARRAGHGARRRRGLSQAAHQVDIVRLLAGGRATGVRALTGNWDAKRNTEGAYSALLTFEGGSFASLTYNGYGTSTRTNLRLDRASSACARSPAATALARRALRAAPDAAAEAALKNARNYGGSAYRSAAITDPATQAHQHFGTFLISCEGGDLRPMPHGVMVYDAAGARLEPLPPPTVPRVEVIDALERAIASGVPALHDGRWARATLEVCAALLESARTGVEVALHQQVSVR